MVRSAATFNPIQWKFSGEAKKAGFQTEEEMQNYMKEIRK